ncbi:AI-2E family transporter YdiK [Propionivibrio sp.]|uniref:AI-2E family transporter YdiK n=1 Tax=Propionivibrio sp. TaxID=2212460 RepID=UPI003BF1DFCC
MAEIQRDLTRTTLAIICILLLIAASLWVLRPFLAATVWAIMVVVATWPLLKLLEQRFGGRRAPAVAVMTLAMLLLLVVPLWLAISTIAEHADEITNLARKFAATGLPHPPEWVGTLPLVGGKVTVFWVQLADAGPQGIIAEVEPYTASAGKWVIAQAGGLGFMLIQFLLVVILSAILYASGEAGASSVRRFGSRLAGERGENAIILAGQAIRGVALGVGVTAIIQTVLGGVGLAIAGVPFAALLSAVMLMLCIAQLGPGLVLFPAVAWMFWMGDTGWGSFLLVWSLIVGTLDNFLRPILIKKGADLPLLLIFAGVIGGMLGFGLVGIFIGPVVLAVTYTLLEAWIADALGHANTD